MAVIGVLLYRVVFGTVIPISMSIGSCPTDGRDRLRGCAFPIGGTALRRGRRAADDAL